MKKRSFRFVALTSVLMSSVCLSACSVGTVATSDKVEKGSMVDATRLMDQAAAPMPPANTSPVQISNGIWTTGEARISDNGDPLPREWQRDRSFVIKSATLMPLFDIGTQITNITGIPVEFAPEVMGGQTAAAPVASATTSASPAGVNAMLGSMGLSGGQGQSNAVAPGNTAGAEGDTIHPLVGDRAAMKVSFDGRLSDFLNQVGAYFNVSWSYTDNQIRFFKNVTRTYTIHALPSGPSLDSTMGASGSSGATGSSGGVTGGSNQSIKSSIDVEIWKDISTAVQTIVGSSGTVTTAISTGTITVSAPPAIISRVQAYLDGQNARLSKQVSVAVEVLSVDLNKGDQYNLNLGAALSQAGHVAGVLAGPQVAIATTAGSLQAGTVATGGVANGVKLPGGLSLGAIIGALSTQGTVTVKTTASVTTLNGVLAPMQVSNTRGYVQGITITPSNTIQGGAGGTSVGAPTETITTATVTTGFSLNVLPRVDSSGNGLLMQFGINLSDLNGANNGFDNFTTPDGLETIQLPNINTRAFVQQAYIPNGATLVLTGFEQNTNTGNKSGVGNASFMGLGGAQIGSQDRTVIVILMTPTILATDTPMVTVDGQ